MLTRIEVDRLPELEFAEYIRKRCLAALFLYSCNNLFICRFSLNV